MNYSVIGKIKSISGESIAETLIAVLIAAFALLMLAGTVNTSTNLVKKSQTILTEYYKKNNEMESRNGKSLGTATVEIYGISQNVTLYQNDAFKSNPVIAYSKND